jgi:putative transposase
MNKKQELNTLYHCIYSLTYHLVLVTKYRHKSITAPMLERLKEIFSQTSEKWQCELLEFNGESDHVHLLLSVNPKVQLSSFVNNLKTVSSRLIRRDFAHQLAKTYLKPVFWSRTYCILTCGGAPLEIIKQYIEQQNGVD